MVQTTADLAHVPSAEAPVAHHRVGWGQIFLRFLRRDKIGAAAFVVFAFFVFLAIVRAVAHLHRERSPTSVSSTASPPASISWAPTTPGTTSSPRSSAAPAA